jgi:hypothetical protein
VPPVAGAAGHLPSTVDVTVSVLKATPVSLSASATNLTYGSRLDTSSLIRPHVTGVFGETIRGDVVWTDPDIIPSDVLGEVGIYTASVTFTPTGTFAEVYEPTTFTLDVRVIPDTKVIDELAGDIATPLLLVIHSENYTQEALTELPVLTPHLTYLIIPPP